MAKINIKPDLLLGKHISFDKKVSGELFSLSDDILCYENIEGFVKGFLVDEQGVSLLVDGDYYLVSEIELLKIS